MLPAVDAPKAELVLIVLGLKLKPPNPPVLLPNELVDPNAEPDAGAALLLEAPPNEKPEVAGAVVLGVGCGLPKENPTLEVKPLGEPPDVPKPKEPVALGDVAALLPNENGFGGVEPVPLVLAAGAPKEKPVNGLGVLDAGFSASSAFFASDGKVSTWRSGEGCLARLFAPG